LNRLLGVLKSTTKGGRIWKACVSGTQGDKDNNEQDMVNHYLETALIAIHSTLEARVAHNIFGKAGSGSLTGSDMKAEGGIDYTKQELGELAIAHRNAKMAEMLSSIGPNSEYLNVTNNHAGNLPNGSNQFMMHSPGKSNPPLSAPNTPKGQGTRFGSSGSQTNSTYTPDSSQATSPGLSTIGEETEDWRVERKNGWARNNVLWANIDKLILLINKPLNCITFNKDWFKNSPYWLKNWYGEKGERGNITEGIVVYGQNSKDRLKDFRQAIADAMRGQAGTPFYNTLHTRLNFFNAILTCLRWVSNDKQNPGQSCAITDENNLILTDPGGWPNTMEREIKRLREWYSHDHSNGFFNDFSDIERIPPDLTATETDAMVNVSLQGNLHWWSGDLILRALSAFCPGGNWLYNQPTNGDIDRIWGGPDEDVVIEWHIPQGQGLQYAHWLISVKDNNRDLQSLPILSLEFCHVHHRSKGDCGVSAVALAIRAMANRPAFNQSMLTARIHNESCINAQRSEQNLISKNNKFNDEKDRISALIIIAATNNQINPEKKGALLETVNKLAQDDWKTLYSVEGVLEALEDVVTESVVKKPRIKGGRRTKKRKRRKKKTKRKRKYKKKTKMKKKHKRRTRQNK